MLVRTSTRTIKHLFKRPAIQTIPCRSFSLETKPELLFQKPIFQRKFLQELRPVRHFTPSRNRLVEIKQSKCLKQPDSSESTLMTLMRALGFTCGASMFLFTGWILYKYGLKEDETPILGSYVDLTKNDHDGLIVSSKKFKKIDDKRKGHLSGSVVENIETKQIYLEKGAVDHNSLIAELIIADFLCMVCPDQPRSIIVEKMLESGKAQFYTLSEILPDSMDFEDFVMKVNWKEELEKVPLVGFAEAMAAKLAFGTELKLQNLLVTRKKDAEGRVVAYVVTAIDHELLGLDFFRENMFTSDPIAMLDKVKDFHAHDPEMNNLPLAGTLLVCEFRDYVIAKDFVKESDVIEFYKKMIRINPRKVDKIMHAIDGENGVMTDQERENFKYMIENVQKKARDFLINHHIEEPKIRIKR